MKKILFVFNHPAPYKVKMLNSLSKHFDLTVIFERKGNKDRNKLFYSEKHYEFKTIEVQGVALGKENFLSFGIRKFLKHNNFDLVIMNGYSSFAEMNAIKYLKKNHIKYALYINGGIIKEKEFKLKKLLKTKYISGANCYFSPDQLSNKYLTYYGAKEELIHNYPYSTIYDNEIIKEKFDSASKNALKADYKLEGNKTIVSVGQLIKRKNFDALIKEWSKMPIDWYLYIIGDGKKDKNTLDLIGKLHLNNVFLLGYKKQDELFKYLRLADAFIFPSNEDIYGHVINESLSQGTPVISTKYVNSAIKLLKNGENGFVLNDLNAEEIKRDLEVLFAKDTFNNCLNTAKRNTIEEMVINHVKIINEVIEK